MATARLVTVADTPTQLSEGGCVVTLKGASGAMFVGGSDVDDTDGFPFADTDTSPLLIPLASGEPLFAVVATGTETVSVLETS